MAAAGYWLPLAAAALSAGRLTPRRSTATDCIGRGAKLTSKNLNTIWSLAANNVINQDAIREAGGIPPLVALLAAGADNEAAMNAAGALRNLAAGTVALENAVLEAGAIPRLVTQLHINHEGSVRAQHLAASVLYHLAEGSKANVELNDVSAIPDCKTVADPAS